jgi:hypothetical protein
MRFHESRRLSIQEDEKIVLLAKDFNSLNASRLRHYSFLCGRGISMEGERIDCKGIKGVRDLANRIFDSPPLPENFSEPDCCRLLVLLFKWLENEEERNVYLALGKLKEGERQEEFSFSADREST